MENQEIWKDIPGYEGEYQVSDLGRVKSLKFGKERILKPSENGKGYLIVCITKNNIVKSSTVHQLIVMTFLNHISNGMDYVIDHINSIKTDNRLENLRIITNRENINKIGERKNKSSKYPGVSWHKNNNKWNSRILINNNLKHLGYFHSEEEAHEAYQNALKTLV